MQRVSELQMNCPYVSRCRRYAYSVYLMRVGWDRFPPAIYQLFLEGYATQDMLDERAGGRIFAEMMPSRSSGQVANLCPEYNGKGHRGCHEYKREAATQERIRKSRERLAAHRRDVHGNPRSHIPKPVRQQVAQRARYKCEYCGVVHGKYVDGTRVKCVVDHVVPLAQGGHPTDMGNLAFACHQCNTIKGTEIWERGCRKGDSK